MATPRLRVRLLGWFLAAIFVAASGSALVVVATRPDPALAPRPFVARALATRLARIWDDPAACDAYLHEASETTGFDLRLRRDPTTLPRAVRSARGSGQIAFAPGEGAFIPVVLRGNVVGAIELDAEPPSPAWPRVVLALLAALAVLAIAADRVARRLARPLEGVAAAADRFGQGELEARAALDPSHAGSAEAEHLARAFDAMAERVERTLRDQRELLAAVSHELRSPLHRAEVALGILRERAEARGDDAQAIDDVGRQLHDVDVILGDLLAVARAGLTDVRAEPFALLPWLRARLAKERDPVELVLEGDEARVEAAKVAGDPALLARALDNLLRNARVHGHPAGEPLLVSVAREGPRVRMEVHDRGPGFPEELLARVFEPFVRGDRARSHAPSHEGGAGIGLALVKRIAEAHGGSAHARNRSEGEGATGEGAKREGAKREGATGAVVGFELPLAETASAADLASRPLPP